jgi:hypothetical protein
MADALEAVRAQLAGRQVHLTRRQLLRALGVTGLGVAALGRMLDGGRDEARTFPTLRSLLAVAPVAADDDDGDDDDDGGGHATPQRGSDLPATNRAQEGKFGVMFKDLPPFGPPDALLSALAARMVEPQGGADSANDNAAIPSGFTPLGQFIDHDLTLDRTPLALAQADPLALTNFRSPRYDLDAIYGGGPAESPQLYDPADPARLLVAGRDLPRLETGRAVLVEGRNDENVLISQLHVAFLLFHNKMVDLLRRMGVPADGVFETARKYCRWHYQWMVVHDFLPRVIGQSLVDEIMGGGDDDDDDDGGNRPNLRFYRPAHPDQPMMPVEFSAAAYRFGHSMVRPRYTINGTGSKDLFGPAASDTNLNGGRPITPALVVDWSHLFATSASRAPQPSRKIDSRLSLPLHALPGTIVRQPDPMVSLAERNLIRGKRLGLPSGQRVARAIGATPLTNAQLGLTEAGWGGEAPLWYYILKEAELRQGGQRLGPVGGRIVGEVLTGLLSLDPTSYLNAAPGIRPVPPIAAVPGRFTMVDLLRFAGVA